MGLKGYKHTEEAKLRIGLYWKNRKRPKSTRLKMSLAQKKRVLNGNHSLQYTRNKEFREKFGLSKTGPLAWNWRGDKVEYRGLHNWVSRKLGKPRKCEDCGNQGLRHRQYHWSNISGNYKRIISDWRRLCVKCHKAFDKNRV